MSSTGGGQYNFTTGQTISSLASSTQSAITAPILLRDNATLAFDVAAGTVSGGIDLTDSGAINGTGGGLSKIGAGTLALGGVNTYTGTTTVSNGTAAGERLDCGRSGRERRHPRRHRHRRQFRHRQLRRHAVAGR